MECDDVQQGGVQTWVVALPNHSPYSFTRLKRTFLSEDSRHCVVLVDVRKLLACADRDESDYILPPVDDWPVGKINGLRAFLEPEQVRIPEMPYITCREKRTPGLTGLIGLTKVVSVSFRNGQHRTRYIAFAGGAVLPVEVHETEAALIRQYCGVSAQTAAAMPA